MYPTPPMPLALNPRPNPTLAALFMAAAFALNLAAPAFAADEKKGEDPFEASFYTGVGIDSFAAGEIEQYLNPESSGDIHSRFVAGFDFQYRVTGKADDHRQLWLYGETVHGMRSTEVNCDDQKNADVCSGAAAGALAIIRNATSLEAFVGMRYEFGLLQNGSPSPARLYVNGQAGFLTVSGSGGDVVDMTQVGFGLRAGDGRYESSYFEVGYGRSDLFLVHPARRCKINGRLSWLPNEVSSKAGARARNPWRRFHVAPFVEMTVDADLGSGSDSIQSYFGFDFDLDYLFGKKTPVLP